MKRLFHVITVLLLVLSFLPAKAQDAKWNRALDRYETICDRCIDLRRRAAAGEDVSPTAVTDLLIELHGLRRALQNAGGTMTPAQKDRFESIRLRYAEVFERKRQSLMQLPSPPVLRAGIPEYASTALPAPPLRIRPVPERQDPETYSGVILYGALPDGCAGAMLTTGFRDLGLFLKGSVRPIVRQPDYSCLSDGTTTDGGVIWTSGRETLTRISFTAGLMYAPLPWLGCYAGAGIGRRTVLWEDSDGKWARVSDISDRGLCTDAGIILGLNRLSLLAGVSAIRFRAPQLELGIGVNF